MSKFFVYLTHLLCLIAFIFPKYEVMQQFYCAVGSV